MADSASSGGTLSFIGNLFNIGGGLAQDLLKNEADRINANAKIHLQELLNSGQITQLDYQTRLKQIDNERARIDNAAKQDAQSFGLKIAAVVGAFLLLIGVVVATTIRSVRD